MQLTDMDGAATSAGSRSTPGIDRALHSVRRMQGILQRERARAERYQQPVTLVLFDMANASHRALRRTMRALRRRTRVTDDAGWFDDHRLCVVLPATAKAGAECFARRVARFVERRATPISWATYTYPDCHRMPAEDHHHDRIGRFAWPEAAYFSPSVPVASAIDPPIRTSRRRDRRAQFVVPMLCKPLPGWKRAMDIMGSVIGLTLMLPLMILIVTAIKLTSRGPVFFRQWRAGLGGKPFIIYKFRTMVMDADARKGELREQSEQDGPAFKMTKDPRVTLVGRVLRCLSLDELPQFWNVLKGDMSLVGPRPLPLDEDAECQPWQRQRLLVTPGLTCIWQIRGRSRVSFDEWMRMDLEYIRRRGLWYDLLLLVLTIPAVMSRRGAV